MFGMDPIELMNEKLELIRILKKPHRLRLINPMPALPQLPVNAAPYLTHNLRSMFSSISNKEIMMKKKIELQKIRSSNSKDPEVSFTSRRSHNKANNLPKYKTVDELQHNFISTVRSIKEKVRMEINNSLTPIESEQSREAKFPHILTNTRIISSIKELKRSQVIQKFEESRNRQRSEEQKSAEKSFIKKIKVIRDSQLSSNMNESKKNLRYLEKLNLEMSKPHEYGMSSQAQLKRVEVSKMMKVFTNKYKKNKLQNKHLQPFDSINNLGNDNTEQSVSLNKSNDTLRLIRRRKKLNHSRSEFNTNLQSSAYVQSMQNLGDVISSKSIQMLDSKRYEQKSSFAGGVIPISKHDKSIQISKPSLDKVNTQL